MRRWRLFIPLFMFVLLAALLWRGLALDPNYMPAALENRALPAFAAPGLDGQMLSQEDLKGTVALLNVWATWCPSCHVEHAFLNQLAASGITIYGLNYKDESAAARDWLANKGDPYRLNIVDQSGRIGLDLGVTGAPETYLIDAAGVVRLRHQGPVDARVWENKLKPLFEQLQSGRGT